MAIDLWKGPNGKAGAPTSGDFMVAANWSTGAVPGASANVGMAAGNYSVTLSSAGAEVGSLTLGAGAVLDIRNDTAVAILTLDRDSTSFGRIVARGSGLFMGADATLTNYGEIAYEVANGYAASSQGGTIVNEGVMRAASNGYAQILTTVINDETGIVRASDGGTVDLSGTTTNKGLIEATAHSLVTTVAFGVTGTVTNISGGVLSGGTWAATGDNATLLLANATVNVLGAGATVTLTGAGSTFRTDDGSGTPITLEQTLDTVREGAALEVLGGRDWQGGENFTLEGALRLGGGTFTEADLRGARTSAVSGWGTIGGQARLDGLVRADVNPADRTDTLRFATFTDFNGRIAGNGTLELSGGTDTFTTSHVTVRHLLLDGADVQLDASLRYAGRLDMTTGRLDIKDSTLTLAGTATLGAAAIIGGPGGKLAITGELHAHDADALLGLRTVRVDGVAGVDHGRLTVDGTVSGSGGFSVGAHGTLVFDDHSRLTAAPLVTLAGARATLQFDNLDSGGARVAGFDGHDTIDFATFASADARLSWRGDDDGQGGTLRLINATQSVTVHLEENHVRADFAIASDGRSGTEVTLADPAARAGAPFASASAAAFGGDTADAAPAPGLSASPGHDLHLLALLV